MTQAGRATCPPSAGNKPARSKGCEAGSFFRPAALTLRVVYTPRKAALCAAQSASVRASDFASIGA